MSSLLPSIKYSATGVILLSLLVSFTLTSSTPQETNVWIKHSDKNGSEQEAELNLKEVYLDLTHAIEEIVNEGNSTYVDFVRDALRKSPMVHYTSDLLVSEMWKLTYATALILTSKETNSSLQKRLLVTFRYRDSITNGEFLWSTSHITTVLGVDLVSGFIFDREGAPSNPVLNGKISLIKHARATVNAYFGGNTNHPVRIGVSFAEAQLGCPHSVAHLEHADTLLVKIDFEPEVKFPLSEKMFSRYMDTVLNRTVEFIESGKNMNITKQHDIKLVYYFRLSLTSLKSKKVKVGAKPNVDEDSDIMVMMMRKLFLVYYNILQDYVAKWKSDHPEIECILGDFQELSKTKSKSDNNGVNPVPYLTKPGVNQSAGNEPEDLCGFQQNFQQNFVIAEDLWNSWSDTGSNLNSTLSKCENLTEIDLSIMMEQKVENPEKTNNSSANLNFTDRIKHLRKNLSLGNNLNISTLQIPSAELRRPSFKKYLKILSTTKKHKIGCLVPFGDTLTRRVFESHKLKIRLNVECNPILKFETFTQILLQFRLDFSKMTEFDYSFQWYSRLSRDDVRLRTFSRNPGFYSGIVKYNLLQVLVAREIFIKESLPAQNIRFILHFIDTPLPLPSDSRVNNSSTVTKCDNHEDNQRCIIHSKTNINYDYNNNANSNVRDLFVGWAGLHNLQIILS